MAWHRSSELQAMLRRAGTRGWMPGATTAQAAIDSMAEPLLRGRFTGTPG